MEGWRGRGREWRVMVIVESDGERYGGRVLRGRDLGRERERVLTTRRGNSSWFIIAVFCRQIHFSFKLRGRIVNV